MTSLKTTIFAATLTFMAFGAAPVCAGFETGNTVALNALSPNALSPNALSPNALSPNALSPNALSPNALSPNGLASNGTTLNGFEVGNTIAATATQLQGLPKASPTTRLLSFGGTDGAQVVGIELPR